MRQEYRRLEKLEAMRGAAAAYVFFHHYVHCNPELQYLTKFFIFGQLAVLVFFVLSGFVIYYATVARNPDLQFRHYFIRRFRRIYAPFILCLILTYVLRSIAVGELAPAKWGELVGNLLQFQDKKPLGNWFLPYHGNSPLWSLSYEWWFYMMFFVVWIATKSWGQMQRWVVFGISLVGFITLWTIPNQFSYYMNYFILWWAGVEMAREWVETGNVTFKGQWPSFVGVGVLTALWFIPAYNHYKAGLPMVLSDHPIVELRHFLSILFVLTFGILWHRLKWVGFWPVFGIFARAAPISYALYIVHVPIILFVEHFRFTGSVYWDFLLVLPSVVFLSWLIEQPIQKAVNKVLR